MSRLSKFLKDPRRYFRDAANKRRQAAPPSSLPAKPFEEQKVVTSALKPPVSVPEHAPVAAKSRWHSSLAMLMQQAEERSADRQWEKALAAWEQVMGHYPRLDKVPAKVVENYSKAARAAGESQAAFSITAQFLKERGRHPSVLREHAESASDLGDARLAIALLEEFLTVRQNAPASTFRKLASIFAEEGMLDNALSTLRRGLAINHASSLLIDAERRIRLDFNHSIPPREYNTVTGDHLFEPVARPFGRGTVAITIKDDPVNSFVKLMLDFGAYLAPVQPTTPLEEADVFIVWGATASPMHDLCRSYAQRFNKPLLTMEYGFVSSMDIAANGSPQHSIIVCPGPIYFDSTQTTAPTALLNSDETFEHAILERASACIARLSTTRVTKYNHAPMIDMKERLKRTDRPKILLVDQRKGDKSVALGLASASSFRRMFEHALAQDDHDIVVKLHPDAISGKFGSYLGDLVHEFNSPRVEFVDYDVNPFSLFDAVDKVYVATSQLGFEAIFSGLEVSCFGAPFYSGWGFTKDMVAIPRRKRTRTREEVFATYYLKYSRYYVPGAENHELENLIDYISEKRQTISLTGETAVPGAEKPRILMIVPSGRMGASGRYMQTLGESLSSLGSKMMIVSEGKWSRKVNGVQWESIDFEGLLMSRHLRAQIQSFSPDIVYVNGVRTRAQRLALEALALTGARLITQAEDDDIDVYLHHTSEPDVAHVTSLDHPEVTSADLQKFLQGVNWDHTVKVLSDPDFDRWVEPLLRMATNRTAIGHTAIWHPYSNRLHSEYGTSTMVVPPVASQFDFDRGPAEPLERAAILERIGVDPERLVFFLGGSIYDYSNDFQVFLRALGELASKTEQKLALVVAGRSQLPVEAIILDTLSSDVQFVHINSPSDSLFMELTRAGDICCSPGLNTRFNLYRLPSRLVKAMAMGKPVLTCETGFGASLRHGANAIVTRGDCPKKWAEQIRPLLSPEKLADIGANGRIFALEHFNSDNIASELQTFCMTLLQDNQPQRPLNIELTASAPLDLPLDASTTFSGLEHLMAGGMQSVDAVVHVGAGSGTELNDYVRLGAKHVVLVEANPEVAKKLDAKANADGSIVTINTAVTARSIPSTSLWLNLDREGGNASKYASVRQPMKSLYDRLAIEPAGTIKVQATSLATVLANVPVNANTLLVLEALGEEGELVKGDFLQRRLGSTKYLLVRTSKQKYFRAGATADDLVQSLTKAGFAVSIVPDLGDDAFCSVVASRSD